MWEDIFRQNRINVLSAIEFFEEELQTLKTALKEKDYKKLHKEMKDANKLYDIFT
jgi:prephenate dehydrogenase